MRIEVEWHRRPQAGGGGVIMNSRWVVKPDVQKALDGGQPVIAFESTVLTHGLPYPDSTKLALRVEEIACEEGCVPATIGVIDGVVHVGMTPDEIDRLAADKRACKSSAFDLAFVIARGASAGTTVSGTLAIAERAGISVFATGGIGGVHRGAGDSFDISHDLQSLARSRVVTVCAGAKAILDLPKTLEYLETAGVCVIGYQTSSFPAFYSCDSGLSLDYSAESADIIARAFMAREQLGLPGGILVAAPIPEEYEIPADQISTSIDLAVEQAAECGVHGKEVTPFLLASLARITAGRSVEANLALLENNARVGARIARAISTEEVRSWRRY
ncbi:MAG TPA: pseudouridine-5'-phosphate glycosidase [Bacillota bacterium]|nr:pseudouridine-5'-phosphate glycosidase [Bacillota bacterium]